MVAARPGGPPGTAPEKIPPIRALKDLVERRMGELRATIRRNLALLSYAVLCTLGAIRSGNGRLTLSALARCLPTPGTQEVRYKRLGRFLNNKHFCAEAMVPALVKVVTGRPGPRRVPILVDQTDVAGVPTIMAGVVHRGRVLPIGFTCVEYAQMRRSLNAVETAFLTLIISSLPRGCRAIFTADRAYGRLPLLQALNALNQLYVLRCKNKVALWQQRNRLFPKDFPSEWGQPVRYPHLLYHKNGQEPVDLIVYRERGFKEPWYLLVPADSEKVLPTQEVVRVYRSRMHIEQGFRDWKTHLGVRGLRLQTDRAVRMGRLLLALALAYIGLLLLGSHDWVQARRRRFETLRRKPRHGTRRTLSVLSHGMLLLAVPDLADRAWVLLLRIVRALARGLCAYRPQPFLEAPS